MADGVQAPAELLERIRAQLASGTTGLDQLAENEPPAPNAGESTSTVAETLALVLLSSAGVAGGVRETTNDIRATRERYLSDDDAAADMFRGNP